jgi:hypothetical protein
MVNITRVASSKGAVATKIFSSCFKESVKKVGLPMALSGLVAFFVMILVSLLEEKGKTKYAEAFVGDLTRTLEDNGIIACFIIPIENGKKKQFGEF